MPLMSVVSWSVGPTSAPVIPKTFHNPGTPFDGGGGGGGGGNYGYGSAFFDGQNDYIETPSSLDFTMGTGDFTVECWFKPGFDTSVNQTYHDYLWEIGNQRVYITIDNGTLYLANFAIGAIANVSIGNIQGEWHHVAVTKASNVYTLWYDGQSQGSGSDSNEITGPTGNEDLIFRIANHTYNTTGTYYYTGHVSNMRVIKGTALYTSNFTVPTTPLAKVTNTVLLTCQDTTGTITDNSDSNHTLNIIGDTVATTNSPFVDPNYTPRGSTYFDGTGDSLDVGTFTIGTDPFTIENWFQPKFNTNGSDTVFLYDVSSEDIRVTFKNGNIRAQLGGETELSYSIGTLDYNTWYYNALQRDSSGNVNFYFNGGVVGNYGGSGQNVSGNTLRIGDKQAGSKEFHGYISNFRIVKGDALYPPANGGSASFDGTGDYIDTTNPLPVTGDFTIEGWIYPTSSGLYDGYFSTCLDTGASGGIVVGKDKFFVTHGGGSSQIGFTSSIENNVWSHIVLQRSSNVFSLYKDGTLQGTATVTVSLTGSTIRLGSRYSNNTSNMLTGFLSNFRIVTGTTVYSGAFTPPTSPLTAISGTQLLTCQNGTGSITDASGNNYTITPNGNTTASGSSPFAKSTTPLTDITNTKLLTCQNSSGAITDASSNNHTVTTNGNAQGSSLHPFQAIGYTNGSYYFSSLNAWNGTNARVITADSNDFNLPDSTDVTVEFWYKIPVTPPTAGNGYLFDLGDGNYGWLAAYAWNQNGTHTLRVGTYFGAIWLADEDLVGMVQNQWYHLAITRESGVWKVYLDGVFQGSKASSALGSFDTYPDRISLGGYHNMSYPNYGVVSYISDFRFVKGLAVYTGNFSPPNGPLTTTGGTYPSTANITNPTSAQTLLLTAQNSSGSFVDNSQYSRSLTSYNTVTTEAGVNTGPPVGGGGSSGASPNMSTLSYSTNFDTANETTAPKDLQFNSDGSKMFVICESTRRIYRYTTSGYSIASASYDSVSYDFSGTTTAVNGFTFNDDGTSFYIIGNYHGGSTSEPIFQFDMSTGYDIANASYSKQGTNSNVSSVASDNTPLKIIFNNDGTRFYHNGSSTNKVHQFSLSTAYDISTISPDSVDLSTSGNTSNRTGMQWNHDGSKLYILDGEGTNPLAIDEYTLTTPYDLSTGSYTTTYDISSATGLTRPEGLHIKPDGTGFHVVDGHKTFATAKVFEFTTSAL